MNRRFFSKFLALGTGSLGLMPSDSDSTEKTATGGEDNPDSTVNNSLKFNPLFGQVPACVADFQILAKTALPRATYEYITSGSTDEVTLHENLAAFRRIRILPPLLAGVDRVDTSTSILGQSISMPILIAPVAGQSLFHADGVLGSARAAAAAHTILGVSSSAGNSVEEIAAASSGPKWFQLYVPKDRGVTRQLVERVHASGYKAIIVTVDLGERKDADLRNRFALPPSVLRKHLIDIGFPITKDMSYSDLLAFNEKAWDLALDWKFFDWLRSVTNLPILLKGVLRPADAQQAIALGLDGIIVSNHGGRRLDGVPSSIEQLPKIADVMDGKAELLLDSGVRRGTDVLKAIALGAKAVLIGRPSAWALAAEGELGVSKVLSFFREELILAMQTSGCPSLAAIKKPLLMM
jgi:4-hydroxymandelate oxidase